MKKHLFAVCIFLFLIGSAGANLVENGSFEVGTWGWSPVFWLESQIEIDATSAHHGEKYLLLCGNHVTDNGWVFRRIQSQYVNLLPGTRYTLSFYAKSNGSNPWIRASLISGFQKRDKKYPRVHKRFRLTNVWNKYELPIQARNTRNNAYVIEFNIGNQKNEISIDDIKLAIQNSRHDQRPIEIASYVSGNGTFLKDDNIPITTMVSDPEDVLEGASLKYQLIDYHGNLINSWEEKLNRQSNRAETNLECDTNWLADRYGIFRLAVELKNSDGDHTAYNEAIFCVLPEQGETDDSSPFGGHFPLTQSNVKIANQLGVKWVRIHDMESFTNWYKFEPTKGDYQIYNDKIQIAQQGGVKILGVIEKPPYWASRRVGAKKSDNIRTFMAFPPSKLSDVRNYVYTMVNRYKGYIKHWEIWNEPYNKPFWKGTDREFVHMMEAIYTSAKAADPECVIVAPAGRLKFIERIFRLGAYEYLDVVSYHQYFDNLHSWDSFDTEKNIVEGIKRLMDEYKIDKPIWNTEGGIVCKSFYEEFIDGNRSKFCRKWKRSRNYSYRLPSELMVKWYVNNLFNGVDKSFYYYQRPDGIGYFDRRNNYQSLLEYDNKIKPHGVAMAVLASFLGSDFEIIQKRTYSRRGNSILGHFLNTKDGALAVCWFAPNGNTMPLSEYSEHNNTVKIFDIMGNEFVSGMENHFGNGHHLKGPFYIKASTVEKIQLWIEKVLM